MYDYIYKYIMLDSTVMYYIIMIIYKLLAYTSTSYIKFYKAPSPPVDTRT